MRPPLQAIPLQATSTAAASTAPAVATTPLIGPIISLLDATRPSAIHRSGRRHRFRRPRALAISPLPPPNQHPPLPNPGMSSSSVLGTHSAVRAARRVGRVPPHTTPTGVRDGGWAAEAGHCECIVVVLCLAVPAVVRSHSRGLSGRPGQRQRQRCRVARAARIGSCSRFTWRRAGGRAGGMSVPRRLSVRLGEHCTRWDLWCGC